MKTDATFIADLKQSQRGVFRIAEYLNRRGYNVQVPALQVRPDFDQRIEYADEYDLMIWKVAGEELKCEVKSHSTVFTCLDDFPYPDMFVDDYHKVSREGFADWYFILNKDKTHFATCSGERLRNYGRRFDFFNKTSEQAQAAIKMPALLMEFREI